MRAEGPALDGLGQDNGWLPRGFRGGLVGRIHLAVIVAAALQSPDLIIGQRLNKLGRPWIAAEEMLANKCTVLGLISLEVTIGCGVHQVDERTIAVCG